MKKFNVSKFFKVVGAVLLMVAFGLLINEERLIARIAPDDQYNLYQKIDRIWEKINDEKIEYPYPPIAAEMTLAEFRLSRKGNKRVWIYVLGSLFTLVGMITEKNKVYVSSSSPESAKL